MTQLLTAEPVIKKHLERLKEQCQELKKRGVNPLMKVLLVGEHPASILYTNNKQKFCRSFGAECEIIRLNEKISENDFLAKLKEIAHDNLVHGCFVQLPLPDHLKHLDLGPLIPASKDVDGFHPENLIGLLRGSSAQSLVPCTPQGILTLLDHYGHEVSGKNIVVLGRSMIVGKPMSLLLLERNATVTLCHSHTPNLKDHTLNADIIISAMGRARFLDQTYIRHDQTQILIDVGINHDSEGHLCGDFDFNAVSALCHAITPVPGGVGKMTILSLAQNLLQAAQNTL